MKLLRYGLAATSIAAIALSVSATQVALSGEMEVTTTVHRLQDASVVEGAEASLIRMDHGISATLSSVGLTEGDAVTMWWIVFNKPEMCSGGECGENDIFNMDADEKFILNDDGSPPFNGASHAAAEISVSYADGQVIDVGGEATFRGQLPVGDLSRTLFGPGLKDTMKAEIHLALRTHQQAIPGQLDTMIYTLNGGCAEAFPNQPCETIQFAVFTPPES